MTTVLANPALQTAAHLALHALLPLLAARMWWKEAWTRAFLFMLGTMAVDLDHLLADPIFDPARCSIGYHPLHTAAAIGGYALMVLLPADRRIKWAGLGLLIHMGVDGLDCLRTGWL